MRKFYFKINAIFENDELSYCVYFAKGYLSKGEQGHGSYASLIAKDEEDLKNKLKKHDFDTFAITNDPIGE